MKENIIPKDANRYVSITKYEVKYFKSMYSSSVWSDRPLSIINIRDIKEIKIIKNKKNSFYILNINLLNEGIYRFGTKDSIVAENIYKILSYLVRIKDKEHSD